jgi:hypothetical protein
MGRRAVPYLRYLMGLDKAVANDRRLHYSQGLIRNDNNNKSQWSPILSVYLVYLCLSSMPLSCAQGGGSTEHVEGDGDGDAETRSLSGSETRSLPGSSSKQTWRHSQRSLCMSFCRRRPAIYRRLFAVAEYSHSTTLPPTLPLSLPLSLF